jgi:hypothetical protein
MTFSTAFNVHVYYRSAIKYAGIEDMPEVFQPEEPLSLEKPEYPG